MNSEESLDKETSVSMHRKSSDFLCERTNEKIIDNALEKSYEETIIPQEVFEEALNEARADEHQKIIGIIKQKIEK